MSMNALQQVSSILQAELNHSVKLAQLLQQEREALKAANLEQVNHLTREKQPHLVQLEQLGRQREQLLKAAGFPGGKSGLQAFIANHPPEQAEPVTALVTQLRQAAKDCRDNNQINGGILNVNRQHLVRALSILRGRDPESSAYGPGGEYTSQVVRQPLIGRV
ncbi:flagella synthesis protein FlgN [uncultured Methylophaga sp.]|jgi:flagella synthesis protein FlgN|uniref:flagella synthesis protein FlgN n=1 Tax=uncultured Methylophaga sp. TaxID=285271 RepID=UPI00261916AF|nr:flagellar protein FlgN [uncultured Methylophaga sp.]